MKTNKFEFTITGLIIALILVSMFAAVFSNFMVQMNSEYGLSGVNSFEKYNATAKVLEYSEDAKDSSDISQESGVLDIIGSYFTRGYAAMKTSLASLDLATDMLEDATKDADILGGIDFMSYLSMIIIIAIFIGVVIAVLVKMRI